MPSIRNDEFSVEIVKETIEVGSRLIEPIVLSEVAQLAVSFDTTVLVDERHGPWSGTVDVVGVDGPDEQVLFNLASFGVPTLTGDVESDTQNWSFSATVPVSVVDEDPGVDVEPVIDGTYWVPGYGPWIDFAGPGGDRIPVPWGGNPDGGPMVPPHVGYTRVFAWLRRTSRDDEIAARIRLRDQAAGEVSYRTDIVTVMV